MPISLHTEHVKIEYMRIYDQMSSNKDWRGKDWITKDIDVEGPFLGFDLLVMMEYLFSSSFVSISIQGEVNW